MSDERPSSLLMAVAALLTWALLLLAGYGLVCLIGRLG